eukprot:scaffold7393_cov497-Prasinococcus_capsulatus_cf.AAC.7
MARGRNHEDSHHFARSLRPALRCSARRAGGRGDWPPQAVSIHHHQSHNRHRRRGKKRRNARRKGGRGFGTRSGCVGGRACCRTPGQAQDDANAATACGRRPGGASAA